MDIHKPKPVHSLREFLSEILVIVIGITIALGGEQAVEWLHWRHEVADTREALLAELSTNLTLVADARRQDPCEKGLLDALERWANDPNASANPAQSLQGASLFGLQTSTWEVAKGGQGAARIPLEERLALARVYNQAGEVNYLISARRASAIEMLALMGRDRLSDAQRERMMDHVAQMRAMHIVWSSNAAAFEADAKRVGAKPPPKAPPLRFPTDCQAPVGIGSLANFGD